MRDGVRLAGADLAAGEPGSDPVPADPRVHPVPQARPHRRRDRAAHPYFAGHGYAGVRVDLRGSGESDGVLHGRVPADRSRTTPRT